MNKCIELANKLIKNQSLEIEEYEYLIENKSEEIVDILNKVLIVGKTKIKFDNIFGKNL